MSISPQRTRDNKKWRAKDEHDYHDLAGSNGLTWIGKKLPQTTYHITQWCCRKGHKWEAPYQNIKQHPSCPSCRWTRIEDYHALASSHGFVWIGSSHPRRASFPTKWRCSKGHEWEVSYANLRKAPSCPTCRLINADDYRVLADELGIEWVGGTIPANAAMPTVWRCSKGHEWEQPYSKIKYAKSGCRRCSYDKRRHTSKNYHELAAERGFEWVGERVPRNVNINTRWRCGLGHEFTAPYNDVLHGRGCAECAIEVQRLTEQNYRDIGKDRGLSWVGQKRPNSVTIHTTWQCPKGHRFRAPYAYIYDGQGCVRCNASSGEQKIAHFLQQKGISFKQEKTFKGLVGLRGGSLRFDFYLPDHHILIEYHGQQHYLDRPQWHAIQAHDRIKQQWVEHHDIPLIVVTYQDRNLNDVLNEALDKHLK